MESVDYQTYFMTYQTNKQISVTLNMWIGKYDFENNQYNRKRHAFVSAHTHTPDSCIYINTTYYLSD